MRTREQLQKGAKSSLDHLKGGSGDYLGPTIEEANSSTCKFPELGEGQATGSLLALIMPS